MHMLSHLGQFKDFLQCHIERKSVRKRHSEVSVRIFAKFHHSCPFAGPAAAGQQRGAEPDLDRGLDRQDAGEHEQAALIARVEEAEGKLK